MRNNYNNSPGGFERWYQNISSCRKGRKNIDRDVDHCIINMEVICISYICIYTHYKTPGPITEEHPWLHCSCTMLCCMFR